MAMSAGNRRTYERSRLRGKVELSWTDSEGNAQITIANCIDISPSGLCVEAPCEIPRDHELQARSDSIRFPGPLKVRNCRRCGPWFRMGLQFPELLIDSETLEKASRTLLQMPSR